MTRQRQPVDQGPGRAPRRCAACGGELRRSHRQYLGGGREAVVSRCVACGVTERGTVRAEAERAGRSARPSRKPLPDGGPPHNPVLSDDALRRLREPD